MYVLSLLLCFSHVCFQTLATICSMLYRIYIFLLYLHGLQLNVTYI